jgi:hypothetical protein
VTHTINDLKPLHGDPCHPLKILSMNLHSTLSSAATGDGFSALTLKKMMRALDRMDELRSTSLTPLKLVVNNMSTTKYALPKDVSVSEEFRAQFDKWALQFFGSTPMIPDGVTYIMLNLDGTKSVVCNQATKDALERALTKSECYSATVLVSSLLNPEQPFYSTSK